MKHETKTTKTCYFSVSSINIIQLHIFKILLKISIKFRFYQELAYILLNYALCNSGVNSRHGLRADGLLSYKCTWRRNWRTIMWKLKTSFETVSVMLSTSRNSIPSIFHFRDTIRLRKLFYAGAYRATAQP